MIQKLGVKLHNRGFCGKVVVTEIDFHFGFDTKRG